MDLNEFLILLSRKKRVVLTATLVFLAMATVFLLVVPLKHESVSRIVVFQEFKEGDSTYNLTQSNIHLSGLLAKMVNSSSFFKEVMDSGYNIDEEYFSPTGSDQGMVRTWKDTVETNVLDGKGGIIEITVYHSDKVQLKQIADAINHIIRTNHSEYHGIEGKVNVKVIDSPHISEFPTKPNVFLVFALALILGLTTSASYVYLFSASPSRGGAKTEHADFKSYLEYPESEDRPDHNQKEREGPSQPRGSADDIPLPIVEEDQEKYLSTQGYEEVDEEFETKNIGGADGKKENITPEEVEKKGDIRNIFG